MLSGQNTNVTKLEIVKVSIRDMITRKEGGKYGVCISLSEQVEGQMKLWMTDVQEIKR